MRIKKSQQMLTFYFLKEMKVKSIVFLVKLII